jgi:hypothetical protein
MLKDITEVEVLDGHRLRLRFEDGIEGVVDLARSLRSLRSTDCCVAKIPRHEKPGAVGTFACEATMRD